MLEFRLLLVYLPKNGWILHDFPISAKADTRWIWFSEVRRLLIVLQLVSVRQIDVFVRRTKALLRVKPGHLRQRLFLRWHVVEIVPGLPILQQVFLQIVQFASRRSCQLL